jgi:hypothetical protein
MSVKLKDAPRICRNRIAFFRGEMFEAAGKELLYRIVASEPELTMLEAIENKFEPTTYVPKPGCHVDYLTPEVCRQIHIIFNELGLNKDVSADTGTGISGQTIEPDSESVGGRECKRLRVN